VYSLFLDYDDIIHTFLNLSRVKIGYNPAMQYRARTDANQAAIVEELRARGYDVDIVHREKKLYDIIVSGVPRWASRAVGLRVEIKRVGGSLTVGEQEYWDRQRHDNLIRADCVQDILNWFGQFS
jgi:hypothetical protein